MEGECWGEEERKLCGCGYRGLESVEGGKTVVGMLKKDTEAYFPVKVLHSNLMTFWERQKMIQDCQVLRKEKADMGRFRAANFLCSW